MPTKKDAELQKIRGRTRTFLDTSQAKEFKDDNATAVVLAPVEAGLSKFIPVTDLPSLDDLPFIPERMRDFAFRYATEYKPVKVWAKTYNVSVVTIDKWLRHEGVRSYIAITRYEQRMFNMAQRVALQRRVYSKMNEIFDTRITADTIGPIVSLVKFAYNITHDPGDAGSRQKGVFNLNVGVNTSSQSYAGVDNPYQQDDSTKVRNVTPKKLAELKADIEELEMMAEDFGVELDE